MIAFYIFSMIFSPQNMMKLGLLLILLPAYAFADIGTSGIDIWVSPPKHIFSIWTGKTVTREVTIFNNSTTSTYNIILSSGDCVADKDGTPICRSYTGTGADPKSLSSWISFEWGWRLSIAPKKEKTVKITFNAPTNATPGGHYGIVYVTPDTGAQQNGVVTMVRQLWVLFQVSVPGKLIYDVSLGEIEIETPFFSAPDPLSYFIKNPQDKKHWPEVVEFFKAELNPYWKKPKLLNTSEFNVNFTIPLSNSGNIDVMPVGRIELYDENGNLLRNIGKEILKTADGLFQGEKIVDYLPINDEWGSILPDGERKRIYTVNWKGFAYETVEEGKRVIKFQSPGEYYSQITMNNTTVIYPWEKLKLSVGEKHIKAKISIEYLGEGGKVVPTELERDIVVRYNYIEKTLNYGILAIILIIILVAWFFFRRYSNRIEELEDEEDTLAHEIAVLERAQQKLKAEKALKEKTVAKKAQEETKKAPAAKTVAKKAPVAKTTTKTTEAKPKKAPTKKTPPKDSPEA